GWISKSLHEGRLLQAAQAASLLCPEFLAAGEDDNGRAFLLIRTLTDSIELRVYLASFQLLSQQARNRFARELGGALARLHQRGFVHGDLFAKHVFVHPETQRVAFIDWQRARHKGSLSWNDRIKDLAALHATLDDALTSNRERCLCLQV